MKFEMSAEERARRLLVLARTNRPASRAFYRYAYQALLKKHDQKHVLYSIRSLSSFLGLKRDAIIL